MSARLFRDDILFLQRFLSCCGFHAAKLDGLYGGKTAAAETAFEAACDDIAASEGSFDPRSERNIRNLQVRAQPLARRSLAALLAAGYQAKIISGIRTYAEQEALYAKGRFGNPGPKVTNARGGESWHNFGLAWDIGLFDNGKYLTGSTPYRGAGAIARLAGIEWGGDWKTFKDLPHYQLDTGGQPVVKGQKLFEAGGRA